MHIDGVRPLHPTPLNDAAKLVGTARTLRFVPNREDLFASHGGGYNAQKRVFDAVGDGEVVVIEARGEAGSGTLGDILAIRAHARGAAGIVTDGGVRDAAAVAAVGIPVYSSGAHPAVLGRKHVPWDADLTIALRRHDRAAWRHHRRRCRRGRGDPARDRRGGRRRGARPGGRGRLDRRARRGGASGRRALPDERRVAGAVRGGARCRRGSSGERPVSQTQPSQETAALEDGKTGR